MERPAQTRRARNYGVDILKIISMFMVVILHILGNGGIVRNNKKYTVTYYTGWLMEALAFCAVNVFGMVSGYLIIESKCKYIKIIPLWLNVAFYSVIITLLFKFVPFFSKYYDRQISSTEIVKSFIPAVNKTYWYFTSYFALYFFMPYINEGLRAVSKESLRKLVIAVILLYTVFPLAHLYRIDVFELKQGYSAWWLGCLYIIGAYFKLYPVKISKFKCFLLFFVSGVMTWLSIFTDRINLYNYDTFFVLMSGIGLFLFFIQVNVTSKILQRLIVLASSLSFSVYLIHVHTIPFRVMGNKFKFICNSPPHILVFKVLTSAFCLYCACSIIDLFRYYLFKYLKVNNLPRILEEKIEEFKARFESSKSEEHIIRDYEYESLNINNSE